TNGTDRFSGRVLSLENDEFRIKGTYAEMRIPQEEVQEIRFARDAQAEKDPEGTREAVRLILQPVGRLTVE
ncbi:MAG: hypothetical protein GWO24_25550, partial [Akkermansiaceae bacterium]|nr:hypothetical protein [Akkermansiaceae bacterium]